MVYEYPLSKAIEDGYTRTPFAVTRSDIDFYKFGDEKLDKLMLIDGVACHERTKGKLEVYAANYEKSHCKALYACGLQRYPSCTMGGAFHKI